MDLIRGIPICWVVDHVFIKAAVIKMTLALDVLVSSFYAYELYSQFASFMLIRRLSLRPMPTKCMPTSFNAYEDFAKPMPTSFIVNLLR